MTKILTTFDKYAKITKIRITLKAKDLTTQLEKLT